MPAPDKCTIDGKYSLYSEDNLKTLSNDFENLSEVQLNNKKPFNECRKRMDREREDRLSKDKKDDYKEEANQYDQKSVNYRLAFFNRTLLVILADPTLIKGDDVSGNDTRPLIEKKDVINKSQWKKSNQAENYFNSLLDKYENERKELMSNASKQSKDKSYYSKSRNNDDEKEFKMSHEDQYKNFKKLMGYEDENDENSEPEGMTDELTFIWNAFNSEINKQRSESSSAIPNTPILTSAGLTALQTFIANVNKAMYKNKSFKFTTNFLKKFKDELCKFFKEKGKLLEELGGGSGDDDAGSEDDDDDDDYDSKSAADENDPKKKFKQVQGGYVRVVDFALKSLTGSIMSDARAMKKITKGMVEAMEKGEEEEEDTDDEEKPGVFAIFKGLLGQAKEMIKAKFKDEKKDPEQNGLLSCLVKMTDELNDERKNVTAFQKAHKQGADGKEEDIDKESSDKGTDVEDTVTKDIYLFISGLKIGKGDKEEEIGKKFISVRSRLLFIKDCLDIRFDYDEKADKKKEQKQAEKKLRKDVCDYLNDFDLNQEGLSITKTQDIIDLLSDKKKMNKFKKQIKEIISKESKLELPDDFTNNNEQYKKERTTFNDLNKLNEIPDRVSNAKNDKIKLYISLDDKDHKSIFESEIAKLKIPTNEDAFLKFVYNYGDNGKNYLKYQAISSYLNEFIKSYEIKEPAIDPKNPDPQKVKLKAEISILTNSISNILDGDKYKSIPKNIYSNLSNPNEEEKLTKKIGDQVAEGETKASSYFTQIEKAYGDGTIIFSDEQKGDIKKKIDELIKCINEYDAAASKYKDNIKDDIKPYIVYDEALMKKETDAMSKKHKEQVNKARFEDNTQLYDKLGDSAIAKSKKDFLLKRAKIGYLYVFLQTQLFEDQFYETTLKQQKEINAKLGKITDLRNKMIKYDIGELSKTIDNDFAKNIEPLLKQFTDDNIQGVIDDIYRNLKQMEKVGDENYDSLYKEYEDIKKIKDIKDINNDKLKKIIFYNSTDWDEKLKEQKDKLEKYKKTENFKKQKEKFDEEVSKKKKTGTYNELLEIIKDENTHYDEADNKNTKLTGDEAKTVKTYLFNRIKLNLIRIYAETSLFGLQTGESEEEKKKYSSINTQLLNKIKELKFWENNIRDVVDILENKNKKNKVKEKDKDGKEVEKDVLDKDYRAKFDNLINKYKNTSDGARNIVSFVAQKTNWLDKGKMDELFKAPDGDLKDLSNDNSNILKDYILGDNLVKLLKSNNTDIKEIKEIIDNNKKLKYNCMSFDEKDFNKELEEAKKIQKKNTL